MKCPLCDHRKARRFCPARNEQICPQCCGEKRVLEVDCPEKCLYLQSGRERDMQDYGKRIRSLDRKTHARIQRVLREHDAAVSHLDYALARARLSSRDLADDDVVEAVELLLETYRTEENGVLYEKTSDNLRVETLRRELRRILEAFRNPEGEESKGIIDPKSMRLTLSGAIECLEFIRTLVGTYAVDRGSSGYLDFLARLAPREQRRSSILAP